MYSGCCIQSDSFVFFVCSWNICKSGALRKKSTAAAIFSISLLVFLCILVSSVSV
jgi:hypothetical protein